MVEAKDKVIRDTVHGNILVKGNFVKYLIDSPYFQRLRHIEQSSIRALFPTARHDRFVHSLGVFHVGDLIASHIEAEGIKDFDLNELYNISNSYRIACLLHDVAHAPFSHTFEEFYGPQKTLYSDLCTILGVKNEQERDFIDDTKQHELASAILVADSELTDPIHDILEGDIELICRMIIGWKYEDADPIHQVKDCFIELLHGDIIDADRIDYACRDVWASGYSTATINVERLVSAIHIAIDEEQKYVVCYDANVLSDIVNVLSVRLFQNRHILNHHTVVYEQELMIKAAECMAQHMFPDGEHPLEKIINIDSIKKENQVKNYTFSHFCDDDLFFLMKQDEENKYFDEIVERNYKRFALWKNPAEFFHLFPNIATTAEISLSDFRETIRPVLEEILNVDDIIIKEVEYKPMKNLSSMPVKVNGEVKYYDQVYPNFMSDSGNFSKTKFTFIFIPLPEKIELLDNYKQDIVSRLMSIFMEYFPHKAVPNS